jgi:RNA polymerase sigma-70 factor (ECF subfamily)
MIECLNTFEDCQTMPPGRSESPGLGRDVASTWVANLQAGVDVEESSRLLYQEFFMVVEQFFRLRRCTPQESEDLAQETFINAFRGIRDFRRDSSLKTWLLHVALNVWRNELRRRFTAKRAAHEVPLENPESGEEEISLRIEADELLNDLLREERRRFIVQELRKLPPQMRRCMLLRVVQDLKYREIAAILRISIDTVKSQLFQARQRLKETLEEVERHD